jgi:hypothetical protein
MLVSIQYGGVTETRAGLIIYIDLTFTYVASPKISFEFPTMNGVKAAAHVQLGIGPPTKDELLVHYPPKFTWHQLRAFVNSGFVLHNADRSDTHEIYQRSRALEA